MTPVTINNKEYFIVKVPEEVNYYILHQEGHVELRDGVRKWILIYPNTCKIILDTQTADESDYRLFIQDEYGYLKDFKHEGMVFEIPIESFHSLLRSLSLPTDKRYIVLEKK